MNSIGISICPGCSIDRAADDATRIAGILGIIVEFKFNDVDCTAFPFGNAGIMAQAYEREVARKVDGPFDRRWINNDPQHPRNIRRPALQQ